MNQNTVQVAPVAATFADDLQPTVPTRVALTKVLIMLALAAWMFWPELCQMARAGLESSDWAHTLAAPLLLLLLCWCRRQVLAASVTTGSVCGLVLILLGLGIYAVCTWPYDYGYPRQCALAPVTAGVVLAGAGWRVFQRCLPMVLLLWLSIPIGPRIWAALIIRPETHTLKAAQMLLDQLPGVNVRLEGPDLDFVRGMQAGTVATGEPRRGAALLFAYAAIGVFVTFARIRPMWQVILLALVAVPVVMVCNLCRIVAWGLINIYVNSNPFSPVPRGVSTVLALLVAYGLFAAFCGLLVRIVLEDDEAHEADDRTAATEI